MYYIMPQAGWKQTLAAADNRRSTQIENNKLEFVYLRSCLAEFS
jgi:hypothetical protein